MPRLELCSVFIAHEWTYSKEYGRLCRFLNDAPNFTWENRSVPEHAPGVAAEALRANLREQIGPADVVFVLTGAYTAKSAWVRWEIEFARGLGKPIIGVVPWGKKSVPEAVKALVCELVLWDTRAIVSAIHRCCPTPASG